MKSSFTPFQNNYYNKTHHQTQTQIKNKTLKHSQKKKKPKLTQPYIFKTLF